MNLKSSIIKLRSIQYIKKQFQQRKIPQVDQSVNIILQQLIKNQQYQCKKIGQRLNKFKIVTDLIRSLKMRYYHYPIQYLVPNWYFRSLIIKLKSPLLIPRFQTQYFVSLMIQQIRKKWKKGSKLQIVDFCSGTGVIGLSLIKQLQSQYQIFVTCIDTNPIAIYYSKINADLNCLSPNKYKLIKGNILDNFQLMRKSNIIVSNPPYLSQKKYKRLQIQVKLFQDRSALISGKQGMDLTNSILDYILDNNLINSAKIIGIQYDGQSVSHLNLQQYIVKDQYGRRRYLIVT